LSSTLNLFLRYDQHAHSIFKKWVSVPTTFEKSGYMLKNLGTLYKTNKTNGNVVFKFIFIYQLNQKDPAQVFSELYRYKKEKKYSPTHILCIQ